MTERTGSDLAWCSEEHSRAGTRFGNDPGAVIVREAAAHDISGRESQYDDRRLRTVVCDHHDRATCVPVAGPICSANVFSSHETPPEFLSYVFITLAEAFALHPS